MTALDVNIPTLKARHANHMSLNSVSSPPGDLLLTACFGQKWAVIHASGSRRRTRSSQYSEGVVILPDCGAGAGADGFELEVEVDVEVVA